jgi:alkylhydroperoxidase/carboxymuconolactone decarboxylase family protein YurZ
MIGVGRRHCETKEQDMPRSADAPGFHSWKARAISQDERELAALSLAVALGAAYAVCAQLAARCRLQATADPTYHRNARAAFLHTAARFLHQARVVLDPGVDMDDWRDPMAGLIQLGTVQAVASPQPAMALDEHAVLAEAMSMLATEAAALATHASGPMAAVVTSVQACIGAATSQLKEAELHDR